MGTVTRGPILPRTVGPGRLSPYFTFRADKLSLQTKVPHLSKVTGDSFRDVVTISSLNLRG